MEVRNPGHDFFKEFLRPYYVITRDGQYLFGTIQKGRRPDRVFYMVPEDYRLGKGQRSFDVERGRKLFSLIEEYVEERDKIVQDGVQGEHHFETGMHVVVSIENPHAAYMAWMGKLMIFPPKNIPISCWNYIIPEKLPEEYVERIKKVWPSFDENEPLTLYDFTGMESDVRKVMNLRIDYFGGAYKKPNLTMVWNRAEHNGLISYHAGCCHGRILKGLSGTGKTTLTVGSDIEQDDALVGMPAHRHGRIEKVHIIGLEAASFAKSEGLTERSPEWRGLMKSREGSIVLAMNIDCENVEYVVKRIHGHDAMVPVAHGEAGRLLCTQYERSGTTNGRFIFQFSDLNPRWGERQTLRAEGLSFRRFDILEPIIRVADPVMAVALDSGCESVITSAVEGKRVGSRVRVYAATDFMAREQAEQAVLKLAVYRDLNLGLDGNLLFFVVNTGSVGAHDVDGFATGRGEDIGVEVSKKLIELLENDRIKQWIVHPAFGYLLPDPRELEERHGMRGFARRFNPLRFYTPDEIRAFIQRDIAERTAYLRELFRGQQREEELRDVISVWERCPIPTAEEIRRFYEEYYGKIE